MKNIKDKVVLIAEVCHMINKAFCESLGDKSQVSWEDAPENIKKSAIDGVGYHILNPDATPENSHEKWLKFKEEDGWTYGPIKDSEKKEHPCMVPYEKLNQFDRSKDYIFRQCVHACMDAFDKFEE